MCGAGVDGEKEEGRSEFYLVAWLLCGVGFRGGWSGDEVKSAPTYLA